MDMGDGEAFVLRPMNCPHHIAFINTMSTSYCEFANPYRWNLAWCNCYENLGALTGQRVREMSLNDGCILSAMTWTNRWVPTYASIDYRFTKISTLTDYRFRLSYRDPKDIHKYFDNDEMWKSSKHVEISHGWHETWTTFDKQKGEAALSTVQKLDIQVKTALGNEETLSTIQLDFLLPERFDLNIGADEKNTVQLWFTVGYSNNGTLYSYSRLKTIKELFPNLVGTQQVTVIPAQMKPTQIMLGKLLNNFVWPWYPCWSGWTYEKMHTRFARLKHKTHQLIVGDKEMEDAELLTFVSLWTKTNTYRSCVRICRKYPFADIVRKSRPEAAHEKRTKTRVFVP